MLSVFVSYRKFFWKKTAMSAQLVSTKHKKRIPLSAKNGTVETESRHELLKS